MTDPALCALFTPSALGTDRYHLLRLCRHRGPPNVGKSTLLNKLLGQKVSITSKSPRLPVTGSWDRRTEENHRPSVIPRVCIEGEAGHQPPDEPRRHQFPGTWPWWCSWWTAPTGPG